MNRYELFKNLSFNELVDFLLGINKCSYCKYYVKRKHCFNKICRKGIEEWLSEEIIARNL